jgi:hypothetical protein
MLRKFSQLIKENNEDLKNRITDHKDFYEIKEELKSMIKNTIDKSGGEYKSFIESFIKNPKDVKIEGLINDSDIYDFYLKWRNDIDEILNDYNFFDEVPSDMNSFGLYDYIIKGTQKAIEIIVNMLSSV